MLPEDRTAKSTTASDCDSTISYMVLILIFLFIVRYVAGFGLETKISPNNI